MFGAHLINDEQQSGVRFTVWAPNADRVCVVGNFNNWTGTSHEMKKVSFQGIWNLFIPGITEREVYKYQIFDANNTSYLRADPFAFYSEIRPQTASIVYDLDDFSWDDASWIKEKESNSVYDQPLNVYELHLGSWKKNNGQSLTYRELAADLIDYVVDLGYTHIEILPIMEHPYDRSWGYQITGFFSANSRFGTPKDFMYFVNQCHQKNIGVILDWVPSHFTKDAHGLRQFDGTSVYEYEDARRAESEWGSLYFDLGKNEVISFLISNALFWLDLFHIDGFRVDAVSSMLYRDFGKKDGEWTLNQYGGRENIEAISFLRKLNETVFQNYPNTLMIAEESTAWPLVTAPTFQDGLGFNLKWNMGWMNDVLRYMELDPLYRKYHHHLLTFSFFYAFSENYVLALSHDEVVHGKKSLLRKMPGDYWQKFANLRVLLGYMMTHPGKKTLFMGAELAQFDEWKDEEQLDWSLLDYDMHKNFQCYIRDLNHIYKREASLHELDFKPDGFSWIEADNSDQSILIFRRFSADSEVMVVCNFTPMTYTNYRIGIPTSNVYKEIFNSDHHHYGGSGVLNHDAVASEQIEWHQQRYSIKINIPPLAITIFKESERGELPFQENKS